jgi:hypothetical protein
MDQHKCALKFKALQVARGNRCLSIISYLHHPLDPRVHQKQALGMADKARPAVNPAKPAYKGIPDGIVMYLLLESLRLQRKDKPTTTSKV